MNFSKKNYFIVIMGLFSWLHRCLIWILTSVDVGDKLDFSVTGTNIPKYDQHLLFAHTEFKGFCSNHNWNFGYVGDLILWNFKLVRIKLKFQILEADWLQLSSSFQSLRNLISHYYPLHVISMSHAALVHVTSSCNGTNLSEMN